MSADFRTGQPVHTPKGDGTFIAAAQGGASAQVALKITADVVRQFRNAGEVGLLSNHQTFPISQITPRQPDYHVS
jgi:hypothetical protein